MSRKQQSSPKVGLGSGRESPLSGTNSPNRLRRPFLRDPPITRVKRIEHYVKFPLLAVDFVNKTETVIVAGGGGPGQHGIGNGMRCFKVNQDADALVLENSFDAKDSVMSLAIHPKDLIVVLAIGKDISILNINGQKIATFKSWKGPLKQDDEHDYQKVTTFSHNGNILFTASSTGLITSWKYPAFSQIDQVVFKGKEEEVQGQDFVSLAIKSDDSIVCIAGELECVLMGLGKDGKFSTQDIQYLHLPSSSNLSASSGGAARKSLKIRCALFGKGLCKDLLFLLINETGSGGRGGRKTLKSTKILAYSFSQEDGGWRLCAKLEVDRNLHASCFAIGPDGSVAAVGSKSNGYIWFIGISSAESSNQSQTNQNQNHHNHSNPGPHVTLKRMSKKFRVKDVAVTDLSFDATCSTLIATCLSGHFYLFPVPKPVAWMRKILIGMAAFIAILCIVVAGFGYQSGGLVPGLQNLSSTLVYPFESVIADDDEAASSPPNAFERPEYYQDEVAEGEEAVSDNRGEEAARDNREQPSSSEKMEI